eukprot:361775-Chlamydomonas_euryale.AAC.1
MEQGFSERPARPACPRQIPPPLLESLAKGSINAARQPRKSRKSRATPTHPHLCVASQQQPLVVQQLHESVRRGWAVAAGEELTSKHVERLRLPAQRQETAYHCEKTCVSSSLTMHQRPDKPVTQQGTHDACPMQYAVRSTMRSDHSAGRVVSSL